MIYVLIETGPNGHDLIGLYSSAEGAQQSASVLVKSMYKNELVKYIGIPYLVDESTLTDLYWIRHEDFMWASHTSGHSGENEHTFFLSWREVDDVTYP